jgi:hypothetical protein
MRLTSKKHSGEDRERETKAAAAAAWIIKYTKLNNTGEQNSTKPEQLV